MAKKEIKTSKKEKPPNVILTSQPIGTLIQIYFNEKINSTWLDPIPHLPSTAVQPANICSYIRTSFNPPNQLEVQLLLTPLTSSLPQRIVYTVHSVTQKHRTFVLRLQCKQHQRNVIHIWANIPLCAEVVSRFPECQTIP